MASQWNGGIAVVDDEKDLTDLIARMLELSGIPVSFKAYDGPEAVKKLRECNPKPQVVIMDYRLPATTGVEVMKEMQRMDKGLKFIFLSADSGAKDEAIQAGADLFLAKPTSMKGLVDAIYRVSGR